MQEAPAAGHRYQSQQDTWGQQLLIENFFTQEKVSYQAVWRWLQAALV